MILLERGSFINLSVIIRISAYKVIIISQCRSEPYIRKKDVRCRSRCEEARHHVAFDSRDFDVARNVIFYRKSRNRFEVLFLGDKRPDETELAKKHDLAPFRKCRVVLGLSKLTTRSDLAWGSDVSALCFFRFIFNSYRFRSWTEIYCGISTTEAPITRF